MANTIGLLLAATLVSQLFNCAWAGPAANVTFTVAPEENTIIIDGVLNFTSQHHLYGKGKLQFLFELRRDDGVAIGTGSSSAPSPATPAGGKYSVRWQVPVLDPGYYALRVTAIAVTAKGHSIDNTDIYLRVTSGTTSRISAAVYLAQSKENGPASSHQPIGASSQSAVTPNLCPRTGCPGDGDPPPPPWRSGTVQSDFRFFNANGGYCPSSRDCFDSRYLSLDFDYTFPLQDGTVEVWRVSDNLVIGRGTTNAGGGFRINWTVQNTSATVNAYLVFRPRQASGHWEVLHTDGSPYYLSAGPYALQNGAIQQIIFPDITFGSSLADANQIANVFDGARRAWAVMSTSNRLTLYMNNLSLLAFSADYPTSLADPEHNRIYLDTNSAFAPQARVMHEMGHIAGYVANQNNSRLYFGHDYCWPATSGTCGWSFNDSEWLGTGFEEAAATFFGDVGLNGPGMHSPHTCYASQTYCSTDQFNEETSVGINCGTDDNRRVIQAVRFLWDVYDTTVDGNYSDTVSHQYYEFFDAISKYGDGYSDHQKNEEYCSTGGAPTYCNRDGRSALDFRYNLLTLTASGDAETARVNNCGP